MKKILSMFFVVLTFISYLNGMEDNVTLQLLQTWKNEIGQTKFDEIMHDQTTIIYPNTSFCTSKKDPIPLPITKQKFYELITNTIPNKDLELSSHAFNLTEEVKCTITSLPEFIIYSLEAKVKKERVHNLILNNYLH